MPGVDDLLKQRLTPQPAQPRPVGQFRLHESSVWIPSPLPDSTAFWPAPPRKHFFHKKHRKILQVFVQRLRTLRGQSNSRYRYLLFLYNPLSPHEHLKMSWQYQLDARYPGPPSLPVVSVQYHDPTHNRFFLQPWSRQMTALNPIAFFPLQLIHPFWIPGLQELYSRFPRHVPVFAYSCRREASMKTLRPCSLQKQNGYVSLQIRAKPLSLWHLLQKTCFHRNQIWYPLFSQQPW